MNNHFQTSQRLQQYLINIVKSALSSSDTNLIKIDTNLECNVPVKDIHKIAGPLIDEWTYETFTQAMNKHTNIKSITSKKSSSLEDIDMSIELDGVTYEILIDVKSASLSKGDNAGKGSNLTSFRKIRPFYVYNPNAIFFILSIKHQNIIRDDKCYGLELLDCNIFELKYVAENELKFNTSMGDQFQISNSMNVTQTERTTDEFIELVDRMYVDKYSQKQLDNLIAEAEEKHFIEIIAYEIIKILDEYESLKKNEILSNLKDNYPDISDSQLEKAMNLLKNNNRIQSISRGKYANAI